MFIVMWIQLELAYRQQWLEWRTRKPYFKANILSETSAVFSGNPTPFHYITFTH
jgi:hypothetical protein